MAPYLVQPEDFPLDHASWSSASWKRVDHANQSATETYFKKSN